MMKKCLVIISVMMANLIICNFLCAYDESSHSKLNEYVVKYSKLDSVLKDQLGIKNGYDALFKNGSKTQSILKWITYGGEAEDYGWWFFGLEDPTTTRAFNHFHDPLKDWDNAGLDSAINWIYQSNYFRSPVSALLWGLKPEEQNFTMNFRGDWSWSKAKEFYYTALTSPSESFRQQSFADCFKALGQVMHLLQDISVPLHTRNDVHILPLESLEETATRTWTYETWVKKNIDAYLDIAPHSPLSMLITDPQPQSQPTDYTTFSPISGLFDRNQYHEGDDIPQNNNILGLSEYSNANFLTNDTMWSYQHPSLNDTNYDSINWLLPESVLAEDGKTDQRIYLRKTAGELVNPLCAADYWLFECYSNIHVLHVFSLDRFCWDAYAKKLIPRAVGYSAAILDYFFRGQLEITAPDEYVYAIIDGSVIEDGKTQQEIKKIKAKVRNVSAREKDEQGNIVTYEQIGAGRIQAVARYKIRPNYQADLSNDPPTWEQMEGVEYSYSVSAKEDIASLSTDEPEEFVFDFSENPIPVGITDLYFQVIFQGTLGNEEDMGIAVGMKDLNEPEHLVHWNSTDYFQMYGVPMTAAQVIAQYPDMSSYPYIYPREINEEISWAGSLQAVYTAPIVATISQLPPGRYSHIIVLFDNPVDNAVWERTHRTMPLYDSTHEYSMAVVINQETNSIPPWENTQVQNFRGIWSHCRSSFIMYYGTFNDSAYLPVPDNPLGPYPVTINFP